MFAHTKQLISESQEQIKKFTNMNQDIVFDNERCFRINEKLEKIYQNISSYRSIIYPDEFCVNSNMAATAKKILNWLEYARKNCASELEIFEKNRQNMHDTIFINLVTLLRDYQPDAIYQAMKKEFNNTHPKIQKWYVNYHSTYKSFWGNLDPDNGDYEVMILRSISFHEHWEDFLWLYNKLKDYRSKKILHMVLLNWMFSMNMNECNENIMDCYFDNDIIKCGKDEVFVDLGTRDGDTVLEYIQNYGENYKRIYCYDIIFEYLEKAKRTLSKYSNIEYRLKAVSDCKEIFKIDLSITALTNDNSGKEYREIPSVIIDQDIEEKITFLKADIEGAEQKAILGSRNHIINDKPKIAFSIYHNNEDIWKIARMIDQICPGYDFYIRYHGTFFAASEITLKCTPMSRQK